MLLDVRDGKGRTPYDVAIEQGQDEMAELLLRSADTCWVPDLDAQDAQDAALRLLQP